MPTFIQIYQTEQSNVHSIHLYLEGIFYKGYEHSAYLFIKHIQHFQIKSRYVKTVGKDIVSIGFPKQSLDRLFSGRILETITDDSGNQIEVICRVDEKGLSEEDFTVWKQSQAETMYQGGAMSSFPRKNQIEAGIADILEQIQIFPVEQRTPMECMTFVSELKKKTTCLDRKEK